MAPHIKYDIWHLYEDHKDHNITKLRRATDRQGNVYQYQDHVFLYILNLPKQKQELLSWKINVERKTKLKALSPKVFLYIMAIVVNYVSNSKVVLYFHSCVTKKSTKSLLQEYNLLKHTFVDAENFG